jgi:hypothetical protein
VEAIAPTPWRSNRQAAAVQQLHTGSYHESSNTSGSLTPTHPPQFPNREPGVMRDLHNRQESSSPPQIPRSSRSPGGRSRHSISPATDQSQPRTQSANNSSHQLKLGQTTQPSEVLSVNYTWGKVSAPGRLDLNMSGIGVLSYLEGKRILSRNRKLDRVNDIVRFISRSETRAYYCWPLEGDEFEIENSWRCTVEWIRLNRVDEVPELEVMVMRVEDLEDIGDGG